jgi:hypothetical protein
VSAAALTEIRKHVSAAIAALASQLELVAMEAGLLSPSVLDEDPSATSAISLSEGLTVPELRTLVYSDALALSDIASGIKGGATGSYLTDDQKRDLAAIVSRSASVGAAVKSTGFMSQIPDGRRWVVEDHNAMHAEEVLQSVREAEKAVVTAEAGVGGFVPVVEPYERTEALNKVLVVGAVAAVVAAVIFFS